MASRYYNRQTRTAPLLGDHDRIVRKPGALVGTTVRYTRYEQVEALAVSFPGRLLFAQGGHWVDPCAGDGRMLGFVERACAAAGAPLPTRWTLCDIADNAALHGQAGDSVDVLCPHDLLALPPSPDVRVVITNWPWYGWARYFDHLQAIYPSAWIAGLSCEQERKDGDRAAWWAGHPFDWEVALPGRQRFDTPGALASGAYPLSVSWFLTEPGRRIPPMYVKRIYAAASPRS
jgi:hypothetical protein